jgi:hypothetical protein
MAQRLPDLSFHLFAATPRNAGAQRVGKYLVSPLIKVLEDGSFASSVSIRSGSGSATTDRVLRLMRVFPCAAEAVAGAHAEALLWIDESRGSRVACAT